MKFGTVEDPKNADFSFDPLYSGNMSGKTKEFNAFIGCSKWSRNDLKNFYPQGLVNEPSYYSTQFNSIEFNATYFKLFPASQFDKWREETVPGFTFFPKVLKDISHTNALLDFEEQIDEFIENISHLKEKLGVVFLQLPDKFGPGVFKDGDTGMERVTNFVKYWRSRCKIPLAIEARQTDWHNDPAASDAFAKLLSENGIANIIIDTPGRRDLMHMHLTTDTGFIRFVGCNDDDVDYKRLDAWAKKIAVWKSEGLKELYFFLHQHSERESPKLAAYFIKRLNKAAGLSLAPPTLIENRPRPAGGMTNLFDG